MSDDRVISFRPKARPAAGRVTVSTNALFLPFSKPLHGPQWAFTALAEIDGDKTPVPIHVSLVAEIADEPDALGWLDRGDDGFSGKLVVGADWEATIRHAAFSATPWNLEISFGADAEGDVVRLTLGMTRVQVSDD